MAKKNAKNNISAEANVSAEAVVETPELETAKEELVMSAKIKTTEREVSSTVVVTNTTNNNLCLVEGGVRITIAPREIKQCRRDDIKTLLTNKVIRNWFDKGILSTNMDADNTSAHEAIAPKELTSAVERHDGVNISASVRKFEAEAPVSISLD